MLMKETDGGRTGGRTPEEILPIDPPSRFALLGLGLGGA